MNIKHILFPTDFSECSRALNPEVEWAVNHFGSDLTLMHIFEIPVTWYGAGEATLINTECLQQFTNDAKKRLDDYSIQVAADRVNRVMAEGDAAWIIKKWVEEHDVDLIMMGTHGYGKFRRALLGSVAMKLLHDVSCPIWVHSGTESDSLKSMRISKILCALELTQEAVPLLQFASDFAQDCGASVRIIHAVPPQIESRPDRYLDLDLHKYLRECATKDIAQSQRDAGTDFAVTITDGWIAQDVVSLAAEQDADLVIVGRGRSRDLFGTFRTQSYDIIRQAPCPVMSYCAPHKNAAPPQKQNESKTVLA